MSNHSQITLDELEKFAWEYIEECENSTTERPTARGVVEVKRKQIPTIEYFLRIWIPRHNAKTICRQTWYNWLNGEDEAKMDTIKKIDGLFRSLGVDIVSNGENGHGIFYAKNVLKWSDRTEIKQTTIQEQPLFTLDLNNIEEPKKLNDSIEPVQLPESTNDNLDSFLNS